MSWFRSSGHNGDYTSFKKFKSTILAITLGWDYNDWHGTAIKNLLTASEMQNYKEGKIKWSSLKIEKSTARRGRDEKNGRKREVEKKTEPIQIKKPRTEAVDVEVTNEMVS
ncbi:hypothetical protein COOONC_22733 [Cooperia oncophora]